MGELTGTTFLVTGANTGIGRATAQALAARGGRVVLACRSESKARPVIDEIAASTGNRELSFLGIDLADLGSVRAAAAAFLSTGEPLHVLINNAGVAGQRGQTAQGFELAFGVNHLGHFLLTTLLLDRIRESGPARVVNLASDSHNQAKGIDFDDLRRPTRGMTGLKDYAVSKLANVAFTQELARRVPAGEVSAFAVHPGVIASDIWKRGPTRLVSLAKRFMKSTEEGAATTLHCATEAALAGVSGRYYARCREKEPNPAATPALGAELWRRSEEWTAA